jgi:hypothetical protein
MKNLMQLKKLIKNLSKEKKYNYPKNINWEEIESLIKTVITLI